MPAKFRVRITRTAERDVENIWSFIAQDSPEEASRFIDRLEDQIATLERFPERCPLIPENEILRTRYRHLLYGNYRTVFRVTGRTVYVLRIVHGASQKDVVIVTNRGKPVAAIQGLKDEDDLEDYLLERSPKFWAMIRRARRGKSVGLDRVRKQLGLEKR